jgi:phage tail sheath protein FI
VFENNGPALWLKIETAVDGYMRSLYRLGYFAGNNESDAYFVTCNGTNNNAATVAAGRAIVDVGFSPATPAEFVIFNLQQPVGQTA